jgi:hypothetical protein
MKVHDAIEQAYKNGYAKGYEDGKKDIRNKLQGIAYEDGEMVSVMVKDGEQLLPFNRVRFGRWEQIGYDKAMDRITCSCCLEYWNIHDNNTEDFNFCPNCGAEMRGDEDENV